MLNPSSAENLNEVHKGQKVFKKDVKIDEQSKTITVKSPS